MSRLINKYVIQTNGGYVSGFYNVQEGSYDYEGQMADFPDVCEGWFKFQNNTFVEDAQKKAEIIAQREEEERQKKREDERIPAQVTYTAMMTNTLIEE